MTDYDELARWAESDPADVLPDAVVHRGTSESRAAALAMLQGVTGDNAGDAELLERSTSAGERPSPSRWRPDRQIPAAANPRTPERDAALGARADAEGRLFSEVLRHAAGKYWLQYLAGRNGPTAGKVTLSNWLVTALSTMRMIYDREPNYPQRSAADCYGSERAPVDCCRGWRHLPPGSSRYS